MAEPSRSSHDYASRALLAGMDRAAEVLFPPNDLRAYYEEDTGGFDVAPDQMPPQARDI